MLDPRRLIPILGIVLTTAMLSEPAEAQLGEAEAIFRQYSPSVAKVEVFEAGAGAPSIVGTAFFVADGLLVTNYHVVNDVVYDPVRYAASVVLSDGSRHDVELAAVSAPMDLALLTVDAVRPVLVLAEGEPERGAPLYSLGHPDDLAQSIVSGTFNGPVEHRATPLFHFTGSLNPGMSGGPTLSASGAVVGVNVSTAGNQLSFLIPVDRVAALVREHRSSGGDERTLLQQVDAQFVRLHGDFVGALVAEGFPSSRMGDLEVPSGPDRYLDCWASRIDDEDDLYEALRHQCEMSDFVFTTQDEPLQLLSFTHFYVDSDELSPFRFQTLYTQFFQNLDGWLPGATDDTTDFACRRANLAGEGAKLRVTLCARRNAKLPSLHDVFVRSAVLGGESSGVVSTLRIAGVPLDDARALIDAYLRGFRWVE
jgi:S1-C subfamily serine protease